MNLELEFRGLGTHTVELDGVSQASYDKICSFFEPLVNSTTTKAREAIADGLQFALETCPSANLSDLYHHVLYRRYLDTKVGSNPEQSWVRTSGEGFELFLAKLYNDRLAPVGIRLTPLIGKVKDSALRRLGIDGAVGSSKVDILIESKRSTRSVINGFGVVGGIHAKASLAERVSDDIPASRIMMAGGLVSALVTLDVKSFPPPHGDLVNRGELGTPEKPSDKRRYIESHGDFDVCLTFNARSHPSAGETASGRKIIRVVPACAPDSLERWLTSRCDECE